MELAPITIFFIFAHLHRVFLSVLFYLFVFLSLSLSLCLRSLFITLFLQMILGVFFHRHLPASVGARPLLGGFVSLPGA